MKPSKDYRSSRATKRMWCQGQVGIEHDLEFKFFHADYRNIGGDGEYYSFTCRRCGRIKDFFDHDHLSELIIDTEYALDYERKMSVWVGAGNVETYENTSLQERVNVSHNGPMYWPRIEKCPTCQGFKAIQVDGGKLDHCHDCRETGEIVYCQCDTCMLFRGEAPKSEENKNTHTLYKHHFRYGTPSEMARIGEGIDKFRQEQKQRELEALLHQMKLKVHAVRQIELREERIADCRRYDVALLESLQTENLTQEQIERVMAPTNHIRLSLEEELLGFQQVLETLKKQSALQAS